MLEKSSTNLNALADALDTFAEAVAVGPDAAGRAALNLSGLGVCGLGLSDDEQRLLLWALAALYREEVAEAFGRWCGLPMPSVLTRAVLRRLAGVQLERCEARWGSALQARGRLQRLGLVQVQADAILPSAALRMRATAGMDWVEDAADDVALLRLPGLLPVLPEVAARRLETLRSHWQGQDPAPLTYLMGPKGTGRRLCARHLSAARGKRLLSVDVGRWPEARDILTLVRDSDWCHAAVLLRFEEPEGAERWRPQIQALLEERVDVLVSLPSGGDPASFRVRAVGWLELAASQQAQRRALWGRYLPHKRRAVALTDEVLAFRFRGAPAEIEALAQQALDLAQLEGGEVALAHLQEAARCTMTRKLAHLAALERPLRGGLGAVVLPPRDVEQLQALLFRVRSRQQVMERWGFGERLGSGLGTVAMFSGPPGTGKTLSARAVASELGVALYRIDLSQVFSKWVGETEKHLGALFDEAEASGAVLLFDEADALFAKRTEVRSSNDRYANLESAFLLQRIEAFTGLCFLTTNMDRSIDDAFIRRMAVHLRFAMPGPAEREAIWRGSLPEAAPLASDVSISALAARFEVSGGAIRNAALRAAFRAAQGERAITQGDLILSAEQESVEAGVLTRQTQR